MTRVFKIATLIQRLFGGFPVSTWLQSDEAIRRAISAFPQDFWDFAKENTKEWTHGYHGYPAMMIPQVARHLIALVKTHAPDTERLFDPFMGSGTSLVEGMLQGLTVTGSDLNPLARLLARVKTTLYDPRDLAEAWAHIVDRYAGLTVHELDFPTFKTSAIGFSPR